MTVQVPVTTETTVTTTTTTTTTTTVTEAETATTTDYREYLFFDGILLIMKQTVSHRVAILKPPAALQVVQADVFLVATATPSKASPELTAIIEARH